MEPEGHLSHVPNFQPLANIANEGAAQPTGRSLLTRREAKSDLTTTPEKTAQYNTLSEKIGNVTSAEQSNAVFTEIVNCKNSNLITPSQYEQLYRQLTSKSTSLDKQNVKPESPSRPEKSAPTQNPVPTKSSEILQQPLISKKSTAVEGKTPKSQKTETAQTKSHGSFFTGFFKSTGKEKAVEHSQESLLELLKKEFPDVKMTEPKDVKNNLLYCKKLNEKLTSNKDISQSTKNAANQYIKKSFEEGVAYLEQSLGDPQLNENNMIDTMYGDNDKQDKIKNQISDLSSTKARLNNLVSNFPESKEKTKELDRKHKATEQAFETAKKKVTIKYDIEAINKPSITEDEAKARLDSTFQEVNSAEQLSKKEFSHANFENAGALHVWDHVSTGRGEATPNTFKEVKIGDLTVGCTSLTNFKKSPYTNEDRFVATEITLNTRGGSVKAPLLGVFDGHGGDQSSQFLTEHLPKFLENEINAFQSPLTDDKMTAALQKAFVKCNQHLFDSGKAGSSGSTATVSLIFEGHIWTANVGDGRAVVVDPQQSHALNEDASPDVPKFKEQAEARGGKVENKRLGDLGVATSFGDFAARGVSVLPQVTKLPLTQLDRNAVLIIGCDGLFDVASTQEVSNATRAMLAEEKKSTGEISQNLATKSRNAKIENFPDYIKNVLGELNETAHIAVFMTTYGEFATTEQDVDVLANLVKEKFNNIHKNDQNKIDDTNKMIDRAKQEVLIAKKKPLNQDDITVVTVNLSSLIQG
ncbi:MAG: protein phosphatase 2C family protein [Verrucomicrobia bacterium]|nr:protein phosphatase 2C family protein [Verrucomicrobiota bacterium]